MSTGPILRLKEDGIRLHLQGLSRQNYNEDDVILEIVVITIATVFNYIIVLLPLY